MALYLRIVFQIHCRPYFDLYVVVDDFVRSNAAAIDHDVFFAVLANDCAQMWLMLFIFIGKHVGGGRRRNGASARMREGRYRSIRFYVAWQ